MRFRNPLQEPNPPRTAEEQDRWLWRTLGGFTAVFLAVGALAVTFTEPSEQAAAHPEQSEITDGRRIGVIQRVHKIGVPGVGGLGLSTYATRFRTCDNSQKLMQLLSYVPTVEGYQRVYDVIQGCPGQVDFVGLDGAINPPPFSGEVLVLDSISRIPLFLDENCNPPQKIPFDLVKCGRATG